MRTIKFRGLRVDGKGWVCGHYYDDDIQAFIISGINTYEVIPDSVGQFTGKLTIDKVEIYEGDLIKTLHEHLPKQVSWNDLHFAWYFEIKPFSKLKVLDKIIGNIHEK
jgi:hypothetical protein